MRITVIAVEEWAGLWSGPDAESDESRDPTTLLSEGHSIDVADVAKHAGGEMVEIEYVSGYDTAADREVTRRGSFDALPLDKWLALTEKPG
jgi:hypothetical protein